MNTGGTAEECAEVLIYLQELDLGLPDTVMHELANNFQWDALLGFDQADIPVILNHRAGNKIVVRAVAESANEINSAVQHLLRDAALKGIEKSTAGSALIIVKSALHIRIQNIRDAFTNVSEFLHEDAMYGGTLYQDETQGERVDLMVIFGGICVD